MQDIMYDKSPLQKIQIDEASQRLIDLSSTSKLDLEKAKQLINDIVNDHHSSGLAVFLTSELLWQMPDLSQELIEKIQLIKEQFVKNDPFIKDLNWSKEGLLDTLEEFCHQTEITPAYFQLEPVDHPQTNQILGLICQQTAARYQSHYQNDPNWIFQAYSHPHSKSPGVWMSQNGQHFKADDFL